MRIYAGKLLTRDGWAEDKTILVENGIVTGVIPGGAENAQARFARVTPSLTDEHLHGGFGCEIMRDGPDEILVWLEKLEKTGTGHVLASLYTEERGVMRRALQNVREVMRRQENGAPGAKVDGVHLEGPYISRDALGAMKGEFARLPSIPDYQALTEGYEDIIRLVSLAPELPGARELSAYLAARSVRVQAGHTDCTCDIAGEVFDEGHVTGVCHFYNAARRFHHREPGLLTAAMLRENVFAECICDMVHVHPDAIRLLYRMKGAEKMMVVSDAVATTGLPDGEYQDDGLRITVKNGESRTESGALNGGGAVQLEEVRRLIGKGFPSADAFRMAAFTPRDYLGLPAVDVKEGAAADFLGLDEAFQVRGILRGNALWRNEVCAQ